jgi:hypothetical protein
MSRKLEWSKWDEPEAYKATRFGSNIWMLSVGRCTFSSPKVISHSFTDFALHHSIIPADRLDPSRPD